MIKLGRFLLLWLFLDLVLSASATVKDQLDGTICISPNKTFHVTVDLFAGELGYMKIEECGDIINPTIGMEFNETYTFVQKDITNYYHPIGFSYAAFGDQEIHAELEPSVTRAPGATCDQDASCPAPMYFLNNEYLGKYSNIPDVTGTRTTHEEDNGLDVYEPLFMRNAHEWTAFGDFSVKLRFDTPGIDRDLFYFCHVHDFMGGRIKLIQEGKLLSTLDTPDLGYEYDQPSPFDQQCGTFGLDAFQLPNPMCPDRFVCDVDKDDKELQAFAQCIDAMNCHQMSGMTTGVKAKNTAVLFVHQMIPHHQNAVNMAKSLIKTNDVKCNDLRDTEDPDCRLLGILYDIVNTQNFQIQAMYDYLDSKRYPYEDDCVVEVRTVSVEGVSASSAFSVGGLVPTAIISSLVWILTVGVF